MADFRAMTAVEVIEALRQSAPTLILLHKRPDADAVGSALALRLWLEAMGSPACCICADEMPEHLAFWGAGLQESLLITAVPAGFEGARIIAVDTASPAQAGELFPELEARVSLMIDHHGTGTPFADHYILPSAAASGEIVLALIRASDVAVTPRMATLLYAAISADTGCFRYSNTTTATHLAAAFLVERGIDTAEINRQLYEAKSLSLLTAEKAGFERLHFYESGRIAILTFPYALQQQLGLKDEHLGTLVDVARCVYGVEIAAAIRETATPGVYRVSMRANVDFDVAAVAARFGGGGHTRAAGATLTADDAERAEAMILEALLQAER